MNERWRAPRKRFVVVGWATVWTLAACSGGGAPRQRGGDAATWRRIESTRGHAWDVAFAPGARQWAAGGSEKLFVRNDPDRGGSARASSAASSARANGTIEWALEDVTGVSYSPDGSLLLASRKTRGLAVYDLDSRSRLAIPPSLAERDRAGAVFLPGRPQATPQILLRGADSTALEIWSVATWRRVRAWTAHARGVEEFAASPDGRSIVSTDGSTAPVRVWDSETGVIVCELAIPDGIDDSVEALAAGPSGRIAAGAGDRILLWELDGAMRHDPVPRVLRHHRGRVAQLAYSADGALLASASAGRVVGSDLEARDVKLWCASSGDLVRTLPWEGGMVWAVAFDPARDRLAVGGEGGVDVWESDESS